LTVTRQTPVLAVDSLTAGYGRKTVVVGATFEVFESEVVGIFGHNGAGKSTLMKALAGEEGVTRSGRVTCMGREIPPRSRVAAIASGLDYAPQGSPVFAGLTVLENLQLVAPKQSEGRFEFVYSMLPRLWDLRMRLGSALSGGERQMVSIGRALMRSPRVLLVDEPSIGLAPRAVEQVYETLSTVAKSGATAVLIVEQNPGVHRICDHSFLMENGRLRALEGESRDEVGQLSHPIAARV
jgi:branched-chain amino acid transport system ATP-binding protein